MMRAEFQQCVCRCHDGIAFIFEHLPAKSSSGSARVIGEVVIQLPTQIARQQRVQQHAERHEQHRKNQH
jgi:hypothetical protein